MCVDWGTRISYEARHRAQNHARVRKAERNKEKVPKRSRSRLCRRNASRDKWGLGARALPLEVDEGASASARIPDCKLSQFELPDVTTFLMQIDNISRL
jgi:hypothetical protein